MNAYTYAAIAIGALPGAIFAAMNWGWAGAVSYGCGIFVGRMTQRREFRELIEQARSRS